MDYGKYAYIKITEIEEQSVDHQSNIPNGAIEFLSGVLNDLVTSQSTISCGEVLAKGDCFFQTQTIINATAQGIISLELLIDDVPILEEERSLFVGENQIILFKAYSPAVETVVNVSLRVKIISQNYACTISANTFGAWGAVAAANKFETVQMRALELDDDVLISYSENNNIYKLKVSKMEQSVTYLDFEFVASGVSHCYAKDKTTGEVYFFRVDSGGNLFYSKDADILQETKIDEGVTVVFARQCEASMPEDILVCYIKNGQPVYRCITNSAFGSLNKLKVPKGTYIDIEIPKTEIDGQMFVVCTHENLSNYILYSQNEDLFTKFVDSLSASILINYTNYIMMSPQNGRDAVETLKATIEFYGVRVLLDAADFCLNKCVDTLSAKISHEHSTYPIEVGGVEEINYELYFNQLETYASVPRVVLRADCADWQPASLDLDASATGKLSDPSGILQKWPFNKIKPCLVKDGELIGYLNPDDYAQFEDGSPADITNEIYDVMVEFPKIYYKIEEQWDGSCSRTACTQSEITVYISNVKKDGYVCLAHMRKGVEYDSIYISAYENFVFDGKINTHSGVPSNYTANSNAATVISHLDFVENFSDYKGEQYGTFCYHAVTMLQILSLLLFQEYNGAVFGIGYKSPALFGSTGVNDKVGMYYGKNDIHTNNKLFGLENIIGNSATCVDGILTTQDYHYLIYDPTNPECEINMLATNYNEIIFEKLTSFSNGYLIRNSGNSQYGFLPVCGYSLRSQGKKFYDCNIRIQKPSSYDSTADLSRCPYMTYYYASPDLSYPSMFTLIGGIDNDNIHVQSERLICYPKDKQSKEK